jgi:hypothetical protein
MRHDDTPATDSPTSAVPRCRTCLRKCDTPYCPACTTGAKTRLADIPALLDRLTVAAAGSSTGVGEYVSGGQFGSRPPVALTALALTAVTSEEIALQLVHPQPPNAAGDSIPVFLIGWAAVWRDRWGHSQPAGVRAIPPKPRPRMVEPLPEDPHLRAAHLAARRAVATAARMARLEERRRHVEYMARVALGLGAGQSRDEDGIWRRADSGGNPDTVAEHWVARFGSPARARRLIVDLGYLTTWFEQALTDFDDTADFVVDLRSLTAAARSAVGDRSALITLGRCPEMLLNRETGGEGPCGTPLVRDPWASVVVCPRCRKETGERGLMDLKRQMDAVYGNREEERAA